MDKEVLKTVAEWVVIGTILIGSLIAQDRRITAVEVGLREEMRGYQITVDAMTARLNRIEDKLDRIAEK